MKGGIIKSPMDCITWKYFNILKLSGSFKSFIVGILRIAFSPNTGIATKEETIRNIKKLTIITNTEKISCWNGFIPRKAVNPMPFI